MDNQRTRSAILGRFLRTIILLIAFSFTRAIIVLSIFFQFILLLISKNESFGVRQFCNKLAVYDYQLIRYMTLADNLRPFPFGDFPSVVDPVASEVDMLM